MYDRKTWVVLALCGAILAANLYFSSKATVEKERVARQESIAKAATQPVPDLPTATTAELTVETPLPPTEKIQVVLENDEVVFTLSNIGGGIEYAELKKQFQVGSKSKMVRLNRFGAGSIGGFADNDGTITNQSYTYQENESVAGKKAVFIARLPSGLIAKKTWSLVEGDKPGSRYLLDFKLDLENSAATSVNASRWSLFLGEASPLYQTEIGQSTGFFWSEDGGIEFKDGGKFKKGMIGSAKSIIKSDADKPVDFAGVADQFFATVIRPKEPALAQVWGMGDAVTLTPDAKAVTSVRGGLQLPSGELATGGRTSLSYLVFIGPKHNTMLRKMEGVWGKGWGDVMQYGWFSPVSRVLNSVLNLYHNILAKVADTWAWGLAIILVTISLRVIIWPLQAKSTHTMKKMSKLQPEMAKIKEKYKDDPNKMNTETMGLYRKYGINPIGGCLPMFLQIPVFFGFYRMLQYAVELRGHGFLWVHDLSQPDTLAHIPIFGGVPFNVLPIVMAITSFLQMRMMPKTGDSTQQKIMMFMPLMFFFVCYNFASALALYWTTQNIFQIGQTWLMNRVPEPELKARAVGTKTSWVQRMTERQAEMQKRQKQGGPMRDVTPDKKKRPPRTGG